MPLKLTIHRKLSDGTTATETDGFLKEKAPEDVRVQQMPNGTIILLGNGKWVGLSADVSHWTLDTISTDEPIEGEVSPDADFGLLKLDKEEIIHLKRMSEFFELRAENQMGDKNITSIHGRLTRAIERLFDKVRR